MFQELFGIDLGIAEGPARFLADERKSTSKLRKLSDDTHAATAAAACCLEDQRQTNLGGYSLQGFGIVAQGTF
jgi:hypothetical protein